MCQSKESFVRSLFTAFLRDCTLRVETRTAPEGVFASGIHFADPDESVFDGDPAGDSPVKNYFLLNDTATEVIAITRARKNLTPK